jgi:hypothetical protein
MSNIAEKGKTLFELSKDLYIYKSLNEVSVINKN